jgi:hypothetical protein
VVKCGTVLVRTLLADRCLVDDRLVGSNEFSSGSEIGSEAGERAKETRGHEANSEYEALMAAEYGEAGDDFPPPEALPDIGPRPNAPDAERLESARDGVNPVEDPDEIDAVLYTVDGQAKTTSEGAADAGSDGVADAGSEPAEDAGSEPAGDAGPEPAGDADSEAYDRQAAAREDLGVLVNALDEVSRQLSRLADALRHESSEETDRSPDLEEQVTLAEQIAPEVRQLTGTATELVAQGTDQEPDLAFSAAAQMAALRSDLRFAKKRYSVNRAWKKIWEVLTRAAPRLWSLISHLVKVKEWSVTGEIGTGVLGLAQARISVTFGK